MDVIYPHCCGIDVHKREVVACVVATDADGTPSKLIRAFGTMTLDVLALADWLASHGVTHIAMESTGVYWKPIYNLLEDQFTLLLVNARHVKAVPGRKTDVRDCEWLAELLRHGLLTGSFVPDRPQRELRELTRYRTSLVRERTAAANRLQKTLEGANIKLASVATDILGTSGREMLAALVAGRTDATELAQLAHGRLREKLPQLERALVGCVGPHQRFLVAEQLAHVDFLDAAIAGSAPRSASACARTRRCSPGWTPSPALDAPSPRRWWQKSAPISRASRVPSTWPRGPGSARAIMRVPASGEVVPSGRAVPGCGPAWCRPRMRRPAPKAPTWRPSIGGSQPAAVAQRRPSPSPTPS
jgi:transposase